MVVVAALAIGVIGLVIGAVFATILDFTSGSITGGVIGALLGAVGGGRMDLTPRPEPQEKRGDRRAMTDDDWADFSRAYSARDTEPALAWWFLRLERGDPDDAVLVPVAFEDLTPSEAGPELPSAATQRD